MPPTLYAPGTHAVADADVDPEGHAYPGVHGPLHPAVVSPALLPYRPAGQGVQAPAPPTLNVPGAHMDAVALVDPAGHAYPGAHGPVQDVFVAPVALPKRPAAHGPLQLPLNSPVVFPNVPRGHWLHAPSPGALYSPTGHCTGVLLVLPGAHTYPAVQFPLQAAEVRPGVEP